MESTMHEMTMWGLVSDASLLVKIVMIILVLASMVSWSGKTKPSIPATVQTNSRYHETGFGSE